MITREEKIKTTKHLLMTASTLTLFRMGFFEAAHGWGGGQKGPLSLKSVTHILQWWNLAVIP